ncbi:virion core protein, T7 gp14 family [Lysobacter sp. CA199]|uniref:virion core protein, T7 gp14 family n=1 Tax=Lysobacter sp. CA199 TaxID=3455608 RepID=UPI003F8D8921
MIAGAVYANGEQKKATKEALKVQQSEIDASAATQKNERMEEARALRATARAAAAEAAIGGNSVDAISIDVMGQAGRDVALIETNRRNGTLASSAEANARIRSANAEMVQSIGSAAATGMSGYQNYMIRRKGATEGKTPVAPSPTY